MPGRDKTGPMGQGPMTGRRMGTCSGENAAAYPQERGWGFGRGRRFRGRGRGFGFGFGFGFGPHGSGAGISTESEMALLRDQISQLKHEQEELEKHLRTLEKKGGNSGKEI